MKIKVLGASGTESPGQSSPSILLNHSILFDAGSLTQVLDLKQQLKIRHIFITHAHLDHIVGIPFLAENIVFAKRRLPIRILSIAPVIRAMKRHIFNGSIWPNFTAVPNSRHPVLSLVELESGLPIETERYWVTPYRVHHSVPAVGYLIEDRRKKRFFYTGDTGPLRDLWRRIGEKQLHSLIVEVSFPNRMEDIAAQTGHLTPWLLRRELSKMKHVPGKILVTHLKPKYAEIIEGELEKLRIKNLKLLRDHEVIEI